MERRTVDWIVEMSIAAGRGEVEAADASREGEEELIVALIVCEIGGLFSPRLADGATAANHLADGDTIYTCSRFPVDCLSCILVATPARQGKARQGTLV